MSQCLAWCSAFTSLFVLHEHRDGRFGSIVGQIGPKWDKSGAFSDISVRFALRQAEAPNALKSDLKKTRICPISFQSDPLCSQTYHPCMNMGTYTAGMSINVPSEMDLIGPKWDKSGTF